MLTVDINEEHRQSWLKKTLAEIPQGSRILDAGAGNTKSLQWQRFPD